MKMKPNRFFDSIKFPVLAIAILPAFTLFCLLTAYYSVQRAHDIEEGLDTQGHIIADLVARASEPAIVSGNLEYLRAIVDDQIKRSQVSAITITDTAGTTLLTATNKRLSQANVQRYAAPVMLVRAPAETFDLVEGSGTKPFRPASKALGRVVVQMSTRDMRQKQIAVVLYGLASSFAAMLLTAVFGLRIGNKLVKRIAVIIEGVQRIREGVYDRPIPIGKSESELDRLGANINATAQHLQQLYEQIERHLKQVVREKETADELVSMRTAELGVAHDNARRLIQRTNSAVEAERKKIAREIHDHLNSLVVAIRLDTKGIDRVIQRSTCTDPALPEIKQRVVRILDMLAEVYDMGREIVHRLRPEILDMLGLLGAVQDLIDTYNKLHTGCEFFVECIGDVSDLNEDVAIAVFRIVQESVTNSVKYSNATEVHIRLARPCPQNPEDLCVHIEDNGVGFYPTAPAKGVGLISMRERAHGLGGTLTIRSSPGQGTAIDAVIPVGQVSVSIT